MAEPATEYTEAVIRFGKAAGRIRSVITSLDLTVRILTGSWKTAKVKDRQPSSMEALVLPREGFPTIEEIEKSLNEAQSAWADLNAKYAAVPEAGRAGLQSPGAVLQANRLS